MADGLGISHGRASRNGQPQHQQQQQPVRPPPPPNSDLMAMFVPVREDLTRPFDDAPRSRVDRARATLQAVEDHRVGVRRGIVHYGLLEQQRLRAEFSEKRDRDQEENSPELLTAQEAEVMLGIMRRPAEPDHDYSVTDAIMAQPISVPPPSERPGGRAEAVRHQQLLFEGVLSHLALYETHNQTLRAQWTATVEREQKRLREQFGDSGSGSEPGSEPGPASKPDATVKNNKTTTGTESASAADKPRPKESTNPTTTTTTDGGPARSD